MTELVRVVRTPGAVLMGLGSILGTGLFVSIGIAAGRTGASVVLAVMAAALVATFNGLSSAQLAASHPVSGGTYAYGYKYLGPRFGFVAGWMFLCAKSASAATAALGFSAYVLTAVGGSRAEVHIAVAVTSVLVVTVVVSSGIRRSNLANALIVSLTLITLVVFVVVGAPTALAEARFEPVFTDGPTGFLGATALMFVAYTGYGRIATLGEEVHDPARTIPRAIITTLIVTMVLYAAVAAIAVGTIGPTALAAATEHSAPLEIVARAFAVPGVAYLVAVGAVAAMLGVLLNLVLGLSRVLLAMARQGDMPTFFSAVDSEGSPRRAVWAVGVIIGGLAMIGSVKSTWSFSAFTVLVYYALTNLSALYLPKVERKYPAIVPAIGLVSCLGLAFWVETRFWIAGLVLIGLGLVWQAAAVRYGPGRADLK